ncbi:amidohydrolase family protein [Brachybacterium paraconglomeratum]|uniref:amidohydrolase family protein n=1 Tax=Brachybacterium paraconglomeratum TaxID=173362 RepID=UPI00248F715A|nr:amidohydrolase family protein [Brachybacterium paraconglomeratum]
MPTLTALVPGAYERGLLCIAHAVTAAVFDRGLAAGADILTHVRIDSPLSEGNVQRMRDQGTRVSRTLVMMQVMAHARLAERAEAAVRTALENVHALHEAGSPLLVGTDANETPFAPVPHGPSLHEEIALLGRAGVPAADALHGAAAGVADALRLADRGRLETGLRADLLLVDGDPLEDPAVLRAPRAVWIAGEHVRAGVDDG